jgi:Fe2+ or Zn2+ uptake regulation protein
MTKQQATEALKKEGLDWTSPMVEIIDTLVELADELGMRDPYEVADRAAYRWAA